MSDKLNGKDDDEFYDAVSNPTISHLPSVSQTNEEIIAEVLGEADELQHDEFHDAAVEAEKQDEIIADENEEEENLDARKELENSMTEEELEHNKDEANKLKLAGNELFKTEKADEAIETYNKALELCPLKYTKDRAILYGNRAAAKIQIDSKKSAIEDCTKAVELWPEYVRVILRRAKLFEAEDKLDEALADYNRILELDSSHREAREATIRLPPLINERNERMKEEMISKLKDLGNMILKPFGLSTNNFQMQQDANTGGYSINFKQS